MSDYTNPPHDLLNTGSPGFTFWGDNDTLTINGDFLLGSTDLAGVWSSRDGNTLTNNGNILSGASLGVRFGGNDGTIVNNGGHSIVGEDSGIAVYGDHESIDNSGTVSGLTESGVLLGYGSNHVALTNHGDIYGRNEGVLASSNLEGGLIYNYGTIRSDHRGIDVDTTSGLPTVIVNE